MNISDFDYTLPKNLIANSPAVPRDGSRLLKIDRKTGQISHYIFRDIKEILGLRSGHTSGGGRIEVLLIEEAKHGVWKALTKPGLKIGQTILLKTELDKIELLNLLQKYGTTPLPPYISSKDSESDLRIKYQSTVCAEKLGSVAVPTAGFHFTHRLLKKLKNHGIQIEYVTLHVGLGTFAPVKTEKLEDHPMHFEYFEVEKEVVARLNKAKKSGKRIVAVGTTTTRVLETLAVDSKAPRQLTDKKLNGSTNLFIYPPYKFKFVDALITNFHLPKSTLLCLVSAFVSYPNTNMKFKDFKSSLMGQAYSNAIEKKYRFYSFGDACLIY